MIDTVRGVLRVRRWPKKRPGKQTPQELFWVDWFRQANLLAKYVDAASAIRAIELSRLSGFYPRDILLKAMRGRLYTWRDETGWKWYSMAAIGDISESLDVLAQTIGSVLVRATDRWRTPSPGAVDDVLTYKGPLAAPVWQAAGAGGGAVQEIIPGTPIVPDDTVSEYVLDVTAYKTVQIILDLIGFRASARPFFRFSVDGGLTYKAGASDYREIAIFTGSSGGTLRDKIFITNANSAGNHSCKANFENLRVGRCAFTVTGCRIGSSAGVRDGFALFDGAVTHIKIFSFSTQIFDAGTIRAVGNY